MKRKSEIAKVLAKHGLDWLAHSESPWSFLAAPRQWFAKENGRSQPERLRMALEELGTTYIKLGQAISTRTDLLPPEYVHELSKLQDQTPTVRYADIAEVVQEELGDHPELVFAEFEREPRAAASIAQVHGAITKNGDKVVVKVQRPGTEEKVEQDLEVLQEIATFLQNSTKLGDRYDFCDWFSEFSFTLRNELDFRREGRNADRFRMNFLDDPMVHIPRIYWDHTTRRVITMEDVIGIKITDREQLDASGLNRTLLAENCARIVLTEIFKHGFFHADPHPGNFFVQEDGRIAIIDLGMVGRLELSTRDSLTRMTLGLAREDTDSLVDELLVIGVERGPVHRDEIKADLRRLIQVHLYNNPEQFSLARMFSDTLRVAAEHNIRVPSDLLFLARALAICEGVGRELDPDFRMMDYARSFLMHHYEETRSPKALVERAQNEYTDVSELVIDLPKRLRRLLGQLERGEIAFTAKLDRPERFFEHIQSAANRLSMSVLVAGLIAGLSVLTLTIAPASREGLVDNLLKGMLVLMVLGGIALFASIWRTRKT